jgi:hypothetical protein
MGTSAVVLIAFGIALLVDAPALSGLGVAGLGLVGDRGRMRTFAGRGRARRGIALAAISLVVSLLSGRIEIGTNLIISVALLMPPARRAFETPARRA